MHKHELLKVIHIAYETNADFACILKHWTKKTLMIYLSFSKKKTMNSGLIQHFLTSLNLPQMVDLFVFGYVLEISWYVK